MRLNKYIAMGVCSVGAAVGYITNWQQDGTIKHTLLYSENAMINLTGKWEGCRTIPYRDTGGLWTNGIGYLCGKTKPDNMTLEEVADKYFNTLWIAEQCVLKNFNGITLTQGQREALTDFVFNVGCDKASVVANGKRMTKIRHYALTGRYNEMCDAFLEWSKGRNLKGELVTIKGLYNRRVAEREWCLQ